MSAAWPGMSRADIDQVLAAAVQELGRRGQSFVDWQPSDEMPAAPVCLVEDEFHRCRGDETPI